MPKLSAGSGRALIAEKTGFGDAPEEAKMVGSLLANTSKLPYFTFSSGNGSDLH
jgi:hypothetical protein